MLVDRPLVCLIPIRDAARARAFYEEVLGLRFVNDDGFALSFEVGGRSLRLTKVPELTPHPFSIAAWEVSGIAETVRGLAARGVEFQRYEGMEQDDLGIWTAPGGAAKVAWFRDPDGNLLSVVQAAG